ncbi:Dcm Site-specific DNA methylase [uncultured Caudovirales phage]|uniref:DNA (cytosine-5-)-methyltransferase n=1 Tax=uncultured Caudovirales phage TaxID=2100421 RepID=A0A6J7WHT2_9CAUD|nr:Dcm Site-specific DNA methylase [uncultured Caudovirales phage]
MTTCDELALFPNEESLGGGFPCQDVSVAGNRAGLDGARSGMFWHIVRLIRELEPRWVVLENVPGLLNSQQGRDMGTVLGALANCGYGFAYRVLDAQYFGVPQRRRRVFIVAGRRAGTADSIGPAQILFEPESCGENHSTGDTSREHIAASVDASTSSDSLGVWFTKGRRAQSVDDFETWNTGGVSPTLNVMDNSSESFATVLQASDRGVRRLTPRECERLQGFPDDWTVGHSDRNRYQQTGNAVAVPVMEWITSRLVKVHASFEGAEHGAFCSELQVMYGEDCVCGVRQ